jgi:pimeloyl-ACP methyl ester carboxylesterase
MDFPPVVASLVLCDTFAAIPAELQSTMHAALQFIEQHSMADVAKTRITQAFSEHVNPALRAYWIDEVAHNDKSAYERAARAALSFSIGERLADVQAPALVLVGEEDRVTPPFLSEDLAKRIRAARLVRLPHAGHISNAEQPADFNRAVREFLDSLPAGTK